MSHHIPGHLNEEEKEEYTTKKNEEEPLIERLKGINEDTQLVPANEETGYSGVPSWSLKQVGETQQFNPVPGKEGSVSYAVSVIKSLRWPGSTTVAQVSWYD